jgi:hypothetical protein
MPFLNIDRLEDTTNNIGVCVDLRTLMWSVDELHKWNDQVNYFTMHMYVYESYQEKTDVSVWFVLYHLYGIWP